MKKFTLFVVLLVSSVSFAQLKKVETLKVEEIGKVGPFGMPKTIECTKAGNTYTFEYKDYQYTKIDSYKTFSFEDVENTFESLYAEITAGFENIPEENVTLSLPKYIMSLKFQKAMGITTVTIYLANVTSPDIVSYTAPLTRKQIDKLFGKKK